MQRRGCFLTKVTNVALQTSSLIATLDGTLRIKEGDDSGTL